MQLEKQTSIKPTMARLHVHTEILSNKLTKMNTKDEIRQYLDSQLRASKDDRIQIMQNNFECVLNSAAFCLLITI